MQQNFSWDAADTTMEITDQTIHHRMLHMCKRQCKAKHSLLHSLILLQ
jgi:hypothetical protein